MFKLPLQKRQAQSIVRSRGFRDRAGRPIKNPSAYASAMVRKTYGGFRKRYGGFRKRFSRYGSKRRTYSGYRKRSYY